MGGCDDTKVQNKLFWCNVQCCRFDLSGSSHFNFFTLFFMMTYLWAVLYPVLGMRPNAWHAMLIEAESLRKL